MRQDTAADLRHCTNYSSMQYFRTPQCSQIMASEGQYDIRGRIYGEMTSNRLWKSVWSLECSFELPMPIRSGCGRDQQVPRSWAQPPHSRAHQHQLAMLRWSRLESLRRESGSGGSMAISPIASWGLASLSDLILWAVAWMERWWKGCCLSCPR
jgi:hypothetical protein